MIKCSREEDWEPFRGEICRPIACTLRLRAWTTREGRRTGEQAEKTFSKSFPSGKNSGGMQISCRLFSDVCIREVPGFLLGWQLVPPLCGKKTPVPQDFSPDSKKIACIPDPLDARLQEYFGLWCCLELVGFDCWWHNYREIGEIFILNK